MLKNSIKYTYKGKLTQLKKYGYEKWRNRSDVYEKCVDGYEIDIFRDKTISFSNDIGDIYDWPMEAEFEWLIKDLIQDNLIEIVEK